MKDKIVDMIDEVLPEIQLKEKTSEDSNIYASIARQLEFLKNCYENGLDYRVKLNGKKLNFGIIASRNFAGPEEELEEKISRINSYIIHN
ncbi:immunity protein Tsi6 family protein [Thalassolituus oleivorans]|uniref:Tsi6 domain-containing protein n=1 Tax=Thalassolituus oleivorans MIL-1 TaxID=1298593 RepID=M5DP83_9GAMM|nr:immunity protein Tsi6 family protein [Thalassolituus oleivorans]CCU71298.1 hypothetical protein TOL_0862 [Thalassolituus oleivorans MIL-1]